MTEQDMVNEFVRRFTWAGRIPGSPHEPLDVPTVRELVRDVWNDALGKGGGWGRAEIDRQIVALSRAGVVSLHNHDFPRSVPDQSTLLWAGDFAYCLVALRQQ